MIQAIVKQHDAGALAGKWDIYVHDNGETGDLVLHTNQGYENREFAEHIVERFIAGLSGREDGRPEAVDLLTKWADGRGAHRMLR